MSTKTALSSIETICDVSNEVRFQLARLDVATRQLGAKVGAKAEKTEQMEPSAELNGQPESDEKSSEKKNGYRNRPTKKQWGAVVSILQKIGEDTESAKEQASSMTFEEATEFISEHIQLLRKVG